MAHFRKLSEEQFRLPPSKLPTHGHTHMPTGIEAGQQPTAIDLFSGCGGLTLGLKLADFRVIGAVEIDPLAVETYKVNHPEVKVWPKDIRKLPVSHVMSDLGLQPGELDLLAGCPPCEGFSSMRTLNGSRAITDERNDLVFDFLRYVRVLRPKAIMMENVPELAADDRMQRVLSQLQRFGYLIDDEVVRVLNVADYGVPQRRRRMILLTGRFGQVNFAPQATERKTVRTTIETLPTAGQSGDPLHDFPEKRSDRILKLIHRIPQDGGSRMDLGEEDQLDCHKNCDGFKDVYGRMAWDDVSPTITGGCFNPSKGRFLHPTYDRAITLREAALLQSFPQDYHFSLKRGKLLAAELIGNALPPEFIRQHAGQVHTYLHAAVRSRVAEPQGDPHA